MSKNLDETWLEYLTAALRERLKDRNLIQGRDLEVIIEEIRKDYHVHHCLGNPQQLCLF